MIEFDLWKDKPNNIINENLLSSIAEEIAKKIYKEAQSGTNKPNQIRKFYDEILHFHTKIKADPAKFSALLPYIKMLNSKVAYAHGRGLIGNEFKDFINKGIQKIKDQKDFEVFVNLFEAFLGYYYPLSKSIKG